MTLASTRSGVTPAVIAAEGHATTRVVVSQVMIAALLTGLFLMAGNVLASDQDRNLRIGAPLPLTGPLSPEGLKQKQGYDIWAETVNSQGGIRAGGDAYLVEIIYVDYASNTTKAVQTVDRLITRDRVNFLFAPFGSGAAKAAGAVSEKYRIPTVAATASSKVVYDQGYRYLFGTFTANETLTEPIAEILKSELAELRTVAILSRNDLFPAALANEFKQSALRRGIDVVMFDKYAIGTLEFSSIIARLKAMKPDWFVATGYTNDLILIRAQMNELNVDARAITMIAGPAYREFVEATAHLAENTTGSSWWHPAVSYSGEDVFGSTESFNRAFQTKYGELPDYVQGSAAAAGCVLQLAIEAAGSIEPGKVRDAIASLNVTTFYGPIRFGRDGQIVSLKPPVFQIQDGVPTVIYPPSISQSTLRVAD